MLCLLCVLYVLLEGLSLVGLSLLSRWKGVLYDPILPRLTSLQRTRISERLEEYGRTGRIQGHHPVLGWTTDTAYSSPDRMFTFNADGIRSDREFEHQPPGDILRIAAFGDSFTLGSDVSNEETWQEQLARSRTDVEVLNFGVGGYGLDQAFLRYLHDGLKYRPHVVVIGFMSENIFRSVNVFRPFYNTAYAGNLLTKPRFVLNSDHLVLRDNPLKTVDDLRRFLAQDRQALSEFGMHDYHYHMRYVAGPLDTLPSVRFVKILGQSLRQELNSVVTREGFYNTESEAFRVTERIFEEFYRAVLANDALPVIMVYPDRPDIRAFSLRRTSRYRPLLERFESKRYRFIDLMAAFMRHDPELKSEDVTVGRWGHYNGLGNRIVADFVLQYLHAQDILSPTLVRRKVSEERAKREL